MDMLFPGTRKLRTKTTSRQFGIPARPTSQTCAMTEPVSGRKPVLALFLRLLWAAALALPVFGVHAGAVLSTLYSFTGANDGSGPNALVQGSDGNFYGTTALGGNMNLNLGLGDGTVFKISPEGALTTLYAFSGADGANPAAGLVQGSDGNFYGTTYSGGTNALAAGTVFKISPNGALATLHSFSGDDDGGGPVAGLMQGSDGYFYGTTEGGGKYGDGTVFRISANGVMDSFFSFVGVGDGAYVCAGLVQGSDGDFYGTTVFEGWSGGYGTVFRTSAGGGEETFYSFRGGNDGEYPHAGLALGSDGDFYGTTAGLPGGPGYGTVFKIRIGNIALTTLHSFSGTNDGANPMAALVRGNDGCFYGTTAGGGTYTNGTLFKIDTNGVLTSLYSFTGGNDGASPSATLVRGNDGYFYGTTPGGGAAGFGTVFRLAAGLTVARAAPVFQPVGLTNGMLGLTWSTEVGGTYQLQYNSDLSSSNWSNLGNAVTATGATLSATDFVTNGPRRFYRVVLLQ
jgi:uncharacterized repeat protein (TIGR03803 family)